MNIQKPELASLELSAVVNELHLNGKIDQVYQSEDYDFFIQVHVKGKQMLRIRPGKFMYLTKHKPLLAQTILCMQLRKYLNGSVIDAIEQLGAQRIVKIKTSGTTLYIELFSHGNVVLCDAGDKILCLLHTLTTSSRELKKGLYYKAPPLETDFFALEQHSVDDKLKSSKKESAVKCLATEFGLGGLYAEEICARANIDKKKAPNELSAQERKEIFQKIHTLIKETKAPKGYVYQDIIAPILLKSQNLLKEVPTFNDVLDAHLSKTKAQIESEKKEVLYNQKANSLQHILVQQHEKLKELESDVDQSTRKGDWLYEHYREVKSLLEKCADIQKDDGWKGVESFLKSLKKIKHIDMKEKKVVVEAEK